MARFNVAIQDMGGFRVEYEPEGGFNSWAHHNEVRDEIERALTYYPAMVRLLRRWASRSCVRERGYGCSHCEAKRVLADAQEAL